jgi:hypothetical protein
MNVFVLSGAVATTTVITTMGHTLATVVTKTAFVGPPESQQHAVGFPFAVVSEHEQLLMQANAEDRVHSAALLKLIAASMDRNEDSSFL